MNKHFERKNIHSVSIGKLKIHTLHLKIVLNEDFLLVLFTNGIGINP